ncbi:adenosine deaminase [Stenotrophomonas sp. MMGLT7]|uniref:adenosine deaminase family protein n=1 Tax=Stenotrophomonas sp. MMGLT7 TaxID=2901227 RepID=UPI001E29EDAB|nr:adenosine deaminase [Stenotrophomonas sp. MMGLT7]MCD7099059.1 adenosine deaminase [Stenotrophomonas sp. MMGLT7]
MLLLLAATQGAHARPTAPPADAAVREQQVAALMQQRAGSPALLRRFLQAMPKGGDLHNHLSGSVYAEDYLRWAGEEGWCVQLDTRALRAPPCGQGQAPARELGSRDPALYSQVVDALSMRNFIPGQPQPSGHGRFFSTFGKFGVADLRRADSVVATLEQAARDRVAYVEIMDNPPQSGELGRRVQQLPWRDGDYAGNLRRFERELPGLAREASADRARIDAEVRRKMRCGTSRASPGCTVEYRYLAYALRTLPQPAVFAQIALGYALVEADGSRYSGVNIVAPEDNPVALADYRAHMDMFRFLSARQPKVPLALHAGELTLGLVPPAELRFHIRAAVDAGARRIGHGVDIAYEDDPGRLLADMRSRQVAVEINLSSNDVILGVKGAAHPLSMYLAAGVPVVLSTDDAGVSRSDMTHEYQRAVQEQGLDYPTLKRIARNGLSYAFLPGDGLWQADGAAAPACAAALAAAAPGTARGDCARLLQRSAKARLQWTLETRLAAFEDQVLEEAR